ncbi:uncharacterized protein BP5553_07303 [Venustampulla echinocandica]|uniref:DUF5672 domain-containing protein n=1 Tax=Venustampulla echinocandica TaxID=2656787 RepID=A0A370TJ50_9HELO|nr:uncharacterized protein BP5553_07303 [Venustampulla echinocandica]RDL35372.1 hypothetical protein BP5553_07303 [Venustampulla echinocandica]
MTVGSSIEERRRKSRHILLAAFALLVVLWVFKLSHPKYSIVSSYSEQSPLTQQPSNPSKPPSIPVIKVAPEKNWKSRPVNNALTSDPFNGTIGNKVAVIVETTFRANLVPLLLHFGSVLGPSWPILIYTSVEGIGQFSTSSALGGYLKTGAIQIRTLPQSVFLPNAAAMSELMTGTWLWESLAPAEHILFFQSDSMLCANAARSVDDYFQYDFVGALIGAAKPKAYNGGLSLRKRSSILRVLEESSWHKNHRDKFEDQWYYNRFVTQCTPPNPGCVLIPWDDRFKEIQEQQEAEGIDPETEGAINLPTVGVARTFSVESIDYPHPLGVQEVHRWNNDQMEKLTEWCPESKLCSKEPFKDT